MYRNLVCLSFFVVLLFVHGQEQKDEIDEILGDEALVKTYADCFLDKADCNPVGQELKERIPGALENGCDDCSEDEKSAVRRVFAFLIKNKPELWKELTAKYDPEGKFEKKYGDKLANLSA